MLDKIKDRLLLPILFGIAIFVALSIYADLNDLLIAFSDFKWIYIPLILVLTFLNYIFRFFKWDYYLNCIEINIKKKDSLVVFFSGLTMAVTPAKLGEVFKCYLLKELNDTEMSKSVPIVFAERTTDIIGLIILAAIGFSAFGYGKEALLVLMGFILLVILIIHSKNICLRLINYVGRIRFFSKFANNFTTLYESAYILFDLKNLLIAISISIISWFFECLALFFVLKGFGTDASLLVSTFAFSFSTVMGAVSMIPGGLGVTEGGIIALLMVAGISKEFAVGAALFRLCMLWFGMLIGVVALFFFQKSLYREYPSNTIVEEQ